MTHTTDEAQRLRIGQVCDLLRDEFPDVSISKLRFLQDKGIVQPERTSGGYRAYSVQDVEALRLALRMQRDEFMPLRVIKQELQRRLDGGAPAAAGSDADGENAQRAPIVVRSERSAVTLDPDEPLVSIDAAMRSAGVSREFLEECRSANIVSGVVNEDAQHPRFSRDEVALLTIAGALHRLGLDVRHLRQAAMSAARQGAVVEQYGAAMLKSRDSIQHDRALRTLEELTSDLGEFLRLAFVCDVKSLVRSSSPAHRVSTPLR